MIIKYDSITGEILSYFKIGGTIPEEIPDGEAYFHWLGVIPSPKQNYRVVNNQVVSKSEDEINSINRESLLSGIRSRRDRLLSESDYTQLSDSTHLGTKDEWRLYRQALRDITTQTDLNNIIWPTKPL